MPVLAAVPVITETQPTVEVMRLSCDKETVSQAFKAMESDEKKALNQAFGKFQSFFSSHDASKCKEAIQLIWDIIDENNWGYNPRVNFLLGLMQLANGD